jgi:hypothetical protein
MRTGKLIKTFAQILIACCGILFADVITADHSDIQYWGRIDRSDPENVTFGWPRVMIVTVFEGTSARMIIEDSCGNYDIEIDGTIVKTIVTQSGKTEYELASGLSSGQHLLRIIKRNEHVIEHIVNDLGYIYTHATFSGLILDNGRGLQSPPAKPERRIEFVGDAYTVGLGVESEIPNCTAEQRRQHTNTGKSYAVMVSDACNAEPMILAITAHGVVHNWGDADQSSATSMKHLYPRILPDIDAPWDFRQWVPHVMIVQLGDSDWSEFQIIDYNAPLADVTEFKNGIQYFIDMAFDNYPDLAAMIFLGSTRDILGPAYSYTEEVVNSNSNKPVYIMDFPVFELSGCDYHADVQNQQIIANAVLSKIDDVVDWNTIVNTKKSSAPSITINRIIHGSRIIYPNAAFAAKALCNFSKVDIFRLNGTLEAKLRNGEKADGAVLSNMSKGMYAIKACSEAEKVEYRFVAGW